MFTLWLSVWFCGFTFTLHLWCLGLCLAVRILTWHSAQQRSDSSTLSWAILKEYLAFSHFSEVSLPFIVRERPCLLPLLVFWGSRGLGHLLSHLALYTRDHSLIQPQSVQYTEWWRVCRSGKPCIAPCPCAPRQITPCWTANPCLWCHIDSSRLFLSSY